MPKNAVPLTDASTKLAAEKHDNLKGEEKTQMARRPEPDIPLTRQELADLQKKFGAMSESALQSFYHQAHRRCQFVYQPPTASSIQELVAIWKYLRPRKRSR